MTNNHKCTVLSIKNKITTCEHLDKGSSKSKISCELLNTSNLLKFTFARLLCHLIVSYKHLPKFQLTAIKDFAKLANR